jgi:hypothetical protein
MKGAAVEEIAELIGAEPEAVAAPA